MTIIIIASLFTFDRPSEIFFDKFILITNYVVIRDIKVIQIYLLLFAGN